MSAFIELLVAEWPVVLGILGGFGGLATLITGVPPLIDFWQLRRNGLHPRRITKKTDPDLVGLDELQQHEFGGDVADPVGEVRSHVARSSRGRARKGNSTPYFLAFALKYQREVVGYLTAEYFAHSQTIFLWYLLVDKRRLPAHEIRQRGALMLLAEMVKAADATGVRWQHIITEVEAEPKDILRAKAKLQLFQNAAEELSKRAGRETVRVFKLPIDYRQPILDLRWLSAPDAHEVAEWLLYAPRNISAGLTISRDGGAMSKERVGALLETLLVDAYGHAFPHSMDYKAYCARKFAKYTAAISDPVVLTDQGDTMDAGSRDPEFYGRD